MLLTIKACHYKFFIWKVYHHRNTFPTNFTILIYLSGVKIFYITIFILPILVLYYILELTRICWLTLREFTCLSLLIEPDQQVTMDVHAILLCIILVCFALGHVFLERVCQF